MTGVGDPLNFHLEVGGICNLKTGQKARGDPHDNAHGRDDMVVRLQVVTPT